MADSPRVFLVRAGRRGEDENLAIENNLAVLGFHDVPSLEMATDYPAVRRIVDRTFPHSSAVQRGIHAGQLWKFAVDMEEGDFVVLPLKKSPGKLAVGRVSGPYHYAKIEESDRHIRPVSWHRLDVARSAFGQDIQNSLGSGLTVCRVERPNVAARVAAVLLGKPDPGPPNAPAEPRRPVSLLDLDWSQVEAEPVRPASVFYIQPHGSAFVLNLGFAAIPLIVSAEEKPERIQVRPGARVYMAEREMRYLHQVLTAFIEENARDKQAQQDDD